jgi:hypothetical protein
MDEDFEKFLISYLKHMKEIRWQIEQSMQDVFFMLWEAEGKRGKASEQGVDKAGQDKAEGSAPARAGQELDVCHGQSLKGGDLKMKPNVEARLEGYLELLNEIKGKVGDEATAARILSELAKDVRMEQIREERQVHAEPATARQLQFMKKLGVEIEPGLTKAEASRLIDEELGRNGEE